jgi:hypothetical protein
MTRTSSPNAVTSKKPRAKKAAALVAYKGFDKNLACRDSQYEVGKTYEHPGKIAICSAGFHSCENPFDVLNYYDLIDSRFCIVRASGEIARHLDDSKIASAKLTVEAELKLPDFIGKCITYLLKTAKGENVQAASGYSSKLAASGHFSKLAASGNSSQLAASGCYSQLAASGNSSKLAASGYYSQLAASGNSSKLAASGCYSQLAASGCYSKLAASGNYSQLAALGNYSKLEVEGSKSAAAAVGPNSAVRAVTGTPVAICEYDGNGNPIGFATGIAGKDGVPADTWLIAKDGKLVAA